MIEDEALTFKITLRKLCEISKDTPLELVHVRVSLLLHGHYRFFTADTSGAVEEDVAVLRNARCGNVLWKFGESFDLRIDCSTKFSHLYLKVITCIDDGDIGFLKHLLPLCGREVIVRSCGSNTSIFDCDDLRFDLHRKASVHLLSCRTILEDDGAESMAEELLPQGDDGGGCTHRSIDAFGGEEDKPLHASGIAKGKEIFTE